MTDSLFDTIPDPVARRTDPETSHQAADRAKARVPTHRDLALTTLRAAGSRGLTDFALARITGIPQTSIGVRRCELVRLGLVEDSGMRRPSPSGSPAIVWRSVNRPDEWRDTIEAGT